MKNTRQLIPLLASALCVLVNSAQGDVFNYSYTFGDGVTASGSLTGTANGMFVDNVSNVSLFFNGTEVPGIFASKYDPDTGGYLNDPDVGVPVVSFDVFKNNFVFSNSNLAGGDYSYDSVFSIINYDSPPASPPVYPASSAAAGFSTAQTPPVGTQDVQLEQTSWSLVQVPDQAATAALLILTTLTMALWRRKL